VSTCFGVPFADIEKPPIMIKVVLSLAVLPSASSLEWSVAAVVFVQHQTVYCINPIRLDTERKQDQEQQGGGVRRSGAIGVPVQGFHQ
jgi:hypothetical protein